MTTNDPKPCCVCGNAPTAVKAGWVWYLLCEDCHDPDIGSGTDHMVGTGLSFELAVTEWNAVMEAESEFLVPAACGTCGRECSGPYCSESCAQADALAMGW